MNLTTTPRPAEPAAPQGRHEAPERLATLAALPFAVFRRFRSLSGAAVFPRGLPQRGARPVERVPLAEALTRPWNDDRHFVLYTSTAPYRLNNAALAEHPAAVQLLALDVDRHDGGDFEAWMDGERRKIAALAEAHPGVFAHSTKRGWRALFVLAEPFPITSEADKESFARFYARAASYVFARFGIVADDALTRWNQPVRLPHVVRDGAPFNAEILAGDARALGVFALPADVPETPDLRALAALEPRWGAVAKRWQPTRALFRVVTSSAFDDVPLPPHAERLAAAERWARTEAPRAVQRHGGRATARTVAAMLHVGFALERADVARILTGAYNRARCAPPWRDDELDDLRGMAETVAKTPANAWGFLLTRDRTGLEAARVTLAAAESARREVPLAEVPARLVAAVEAHPAVVLRATYGAGKTHTIARYIATQTTGRVLVVVARHEMGRAWVRALTEAGETSVAYHASVVQRRDADGRRQCDNRTALRVYHEGGDAGRDVCPTCPRARTCPAFAARPPLTARVHVLPREMIAKLPTSADDIVVFDDAAVDLVAWHRLRMRELRRLAGADERLLPTEQGRLARRFVAALLAGPRGAEACAAAGRAAAGLGAPSAPEESALRALAAQLVASGPRAPFLPSTTLAEGGAELGETLRDVGRLRRVLRFAAAVAAGAPVRWSESECTVHGESAAAALLRTHTGRVIVLDAAADVEELRAVRADLHVERLDVSDAGDATRALVFASGATRTALKDPKRRAASFDAWLEAVLAQLTVRRARRPVLVAYKGLAAELRGHPRVVAWEAADPRREVRTAHYGALRGSNRFTRCDAVVTIGDPWLHGDDVEGRAAWLGLNEPAYRIALATAELGQAHGRSRSVRRARRLTHLHVGRLVPDGWGPNVALTPIGGPGGGRTRGAAERAEFGALVAQLGGHRAAAAALGCAVTSVGNWKGGARGLPIATLTRARALAASAAEKRTEPRPQVLENESVSSGEPAGGGACSVPIAPAYKYSLRGCDHPAEGAPLEGGSAGRARGACPEETERTAVAVEVAGPETQASAETLPASPVENEIPSLRALGAGERDERRLRTPDPSTVTPIRPLPSARPSPAEEQARTNAEGARAALALLDALEPSQAARRAAEEVPPWWTHGTREAGAA